MGYSVIIQIEHSGDEEAEYCGTGNSEQYTLDEIQAEINECTIIEELRNIYAKYQLKKNCGKKNK